MSYTIRTSLASDEEALMRLLPRLADFQVPEGRNPRDLWFEDSELMKKALAGKTQNTQVLVATDSSQNVIAIAMYTIKPELLSHSPSAHLEAIAVDPDHARQGIAKKLIDACSDGASKLGATCMSLHVFANNTRARSLYEHCGFDEEIIRCYKNL